jgi:hypothetical protein
VLPTNSNRFGENLSPQVKKMNGKMAIIIQFATEWFKILIFKIANLCKILTMK